MQRLDNLLNALEALPVQLDTIVQETLTSGTFEGLMADANREQLQEGVRSDGTRIDSPPGKPYSLRTMTRKRALGQPTDRVTLKDTGDFHAALRVREHPGLLEMWDDDWKLGKLDDRYGEKILGITDRNMSVLRDLAREDAWARLRAHFNNIT